MSVESAKAFYERMAMDEAFRTQHRNTATDDERREIVLAAGYNFTLEEWQAALDQISEASNGELSEAEPTTVSDGVSLTVLLSKIPPMLPMYGVSYQCLSFYNQIININISAFGSLFPRFSFFWIVSLMLVGIPSRVLSADYYVSPSGSNSNNGTSAQQALATIQKALSLAVAGDTVHLQSGTYMQDFVTVRSGQVGKPITITGPTNAVIKGGGASRIAEINHSYIFLDGFSIDGLYGNSSSASGYRNGYGCGLM